MEVRRNPNPVVKKDGNSQDNQADKFPLDQLPDDILNGKDTSIGQYLSPLDKKHLAEIGSRHLLFSYKADIKPANDLIKQFVTHVVRGEKDEAEKMLQKDSGLLLHKALVVDEAGRTIYGTAYQIALGAKDTSIHYGVEEMAEMIARYFREKLPNGEEVISKQYAEQFPEGFEVQEEIRRKNDSAALHKVFQAIKQAKINQHGQLDQSAEVAIKAFQYYLNQTQTKHIIEMGYHFNDALFEEASKLYEDNYSSFGGYNYNSPGYNYNCPKNRLAAINVIGGIQSYFTGNLARAACTGFDRCVDEKKAIGRSNLLCNGIPFFDSRLGVSHFVYSDRGGWNGVYAGGPGFFHNSNPWVVPSFFRKFMSSKNESRGQNLRGDICGNTHRPV